MKKSDYITRNKQEKCVMARIRRQGKHIQKNFSVKQCGSWEAAEEAARKWIKPQLPLLPPKVTNKDKMTPRNHSGVVGVHYDPGKRILPSGNSADYPGYVGRWQGCKGGLRWSLNTYNGPENAFIHAVVCRRLQSKNRQEIEEAVRLLSVAEKSEILSLRKVETA